jgi:SAM-dependent methyltransferase
MDPAENQLLSSGKHPRANWRLDWFKCPVCKAVDSMVNHSGDSLECLSCATKFPLKSHIPVFFSQFLKDEEIAEKDFWEQRYHGEDDGSFREFTDQAYADIINFFQIPENGLGLEFACGSGAFSDFVRGSTMVGLDISLPLLQSSRSIVPVQGSGDQLPFRDALFDFVMCNAALHHMPDLEQSFREIKRVLKPGGAFYILELNVNHPQRKLVASAASPWRRIFSSTHFSPAENLIPVKTLFSMLEKNNFHVTNFQYVSPTNRQKTWVGNLQKLVSTTLAHGPLAAWLDSYLLVRALLR